MEVIVIFDRPLILVVNLADKLQEFVIVNDLQEVIGLKQASGYNWHLHIPANRLGELKDVKSVFVNVLDK
jgi:hypothetical protein